MQEPRFGGRAPAFFGVAGFIAAVTIFAVVLFLNPFAQPPSEPAPSSAPSQLPKSARLAQPGDCLLILGTSEKVVPTVVTCGAGTYQIVERLDGTSRKEDCESVTASTYYYFYDSELPDSFDFVLCMSKRP